MAVDPGTRERARRVAAEIASRRPEDRTTRSEFLERAVAAIDRISESVSDSELLAAVDVDSDLAFLEALSHLVIPPPVPVNPDDPLAAAKARGEQAKRDILAAQGELLDASEVARRLRTSETEVHRRRITEVLLALPTDSGQYGFPAWQFAEDGLLPGLQPVFDAMTIRSPWMRAQFFLTGDLRLNGRRPLDVLRGGDVEAVRRAGAAYGEQLAS